MLLALAACSSEPTFTGDDDGVLRAAWDEWIGAVGEERVDIDVVEVTELPDGLSTYEYWPSHIVLIDPDAPDPKGELRHWLCSALDEREGISTELGLVPRGFLEKCAVGPLAYTFAPALLDTCGVGADAAALAEAVYPLGAAAPLALDWGRTVEIGEASRVVPAGPGRWVLHEFGGEVEQIWLFDEATGERTLVGEHAADSTQEWSVFGGPDDAVLLEWDAETGAKTVTSLVSGTSTAADISYRYQGVVSAGSVFVASMWSVLLPPEVADLTTGDTHALDLPLMDPAASQHVEGLYASPQGVVVDISEAIYGGEGDVVTIDLGPGRWIHPYDVATDTFRPAIPVPEGFTGAGVLGDRLVGSVSVDGAAVLVALDLDDGSLFVSDLACLSDSVPTLLSDDAAWQWDGATLTSFTLR